MKISQEASSFIPRSLSRYCRSSLFAFAFLLACIQAFSPVATVTRSKHHVAIINTRLYETTETKQEQQEEEKQKAPQYDKIMAKLAKVESVAKGTVLLTVQANGDDNDEWDYQPGHILALEIKGNPKDKTTHTYEDTQKNNGWMRGPYTVTASPSNKELQVLLKLVGEKSQAFADAEPGTPIQVGGKFKVPIVEGIDADSTDQVVLCSTGVGVGPCVGAMEQVAKKIKSDGSTTFPPIHLVASFRTKEEIALADKLNQLQTDYPNQFSWIPIVTSSSDGRVSSSVERLQQALLPAAISQKKNSIHFHLIGNGQMVYEFQQGLEGAGIPKEKVTLEIYFNHQSKPNEQAIEIITKAIQDLKNV